ncbi:MAG: glucose 1-dehydrogenase [Candidatus Krumholzibacteriia bacterium]
MTDRSRPDHIPPPPQPRRPLGPVLEGQKAIVTGAGKGIGRAIALALADAGCDVAVNYRSSEEGARAVAEEVRGRGRDALVVQADVSREDDVERLVGQTVDGFGAVDLLVANSGIQRDAPLTEMTLDQWHQVLAVNLTGQFLCARAAVRQFLAQESRERVSAAAGKIVAISSVHQSIPWAGRANYCASKGGVALFMQTLAQELAPRRIRVNLVAPGAIHTDINRSAWETPEGYRDMLRLIPYRRVGDPADIGRAVAWLASDQADYITGATIYVDGGMMLYPQFAGD